MSKAIRNRVERLEKSIPPNETPSRQKEDLSGWLEPLDNWPEQYFCKNIHKTSEQIAEEIDALRSECRKLADRVRAGEFADLQEILDELPTAALLGMRESLRREENEVRA